jgi:hypothetical protein
MPSNIFDKTDQWKFLPFECIQFTFADTLTVYEIHKLAKGSTFSLVPVFSKVKDNSGNEKAVAYKFTAQANVSQSSLGDFSVLLALFTNDKVVAFNLSLGNLMYINSDEVSLVSKIIVTWKVVYVDAYMGPELQINLSCMFGSDLADNIDSFFNQLWENL